MTTCIMGTGNNVVNDLSPAYPVHPGSILGEELKARGIRQKDFAAQIGMQASHLCAVINGSRNMTPAIAKKITIGLSDIPEHFWVALQERYSSHVQSAKVNPSLLVSGYLNRADVVQPALAEPGVEYGSRVSYNLCIPVKDKALFESLSTRMGWKIIQQPVQGREM